MLFALGVWFLTKSSREKALEKQKQLGPLEDSQKQLVNLYTTTGLMLLLILTTNIDQLEVINAKTSNLKVLYIVSKMLLISISLFAILNIKRWGYYLLGIFWLLEAVVYSYSAVSLYSMGKNDKIVFVMPSLFIHNFFIFLYSLHIFRKKVRETFFKTSLTKEDLKGILKVRGYSQLERIGVFSFYGVLVLIALILFQFYQLKKTEVIVQPTKAIIDNAKHQRIMELMAEGKEDELKELMVIHNNYVNVDKSFVQFRDNNYYLEFRAINARNLPIVLTDVSLEYAFDEAKNLYENKIKINSKVSNDVFVLEPNQVYEKSFLLENIGKENTKKTVSIWLTYHFNLVNHNIEQVAANLIAAFKAID